MRINSLTTFELRFILISSLWQSNMPRTELIYFVPKISSILPIILASKHVPKVIKIAIIN